MMRFLSVDYWRQVREVANSDEEFGLRARAFTATFIFRVTDREELPPIFVRFEEGKVKEVRELEEGESTDFTLEGPYEIWVKVNRGELDPGNAIMSRQLRFRGSMSQIMRYSKAFLRLFNLMQQVPVEY
jgi:putative sterol carrier protein